MLVNHPDVFIQDNPEIKTMTSQTLLKDCPLTGIFSSIVSFLPGLPENRDPFREKDTFCLLWNDGKDFERKFCQIPSFEQNLPKYVLWEAKSAFY